MVPSCPASSWRLAALPARPRASRARPSWHGPACLRSCFPAIDNIVHDSIASGQKLTATNVQMAMCSKTCFTEWLRH